MPKFKLEYLWLDGYTPVANLRGKTMVKEFDSFPSLDQLPEWGFDGKLHAAGRWKRFRLYPQASERLP